MISRIPVKKKSPTRRKKILLFWALIALVLLGSSEREAFLPVAYSAFPLGKEAPETSSAISLWNEANQAFETSSFVQAKDLYEKLILNHPADPFFTEANFRLGLTLLKLEKPKAAITPLRAAVSGWEYSGRGLNARAKLTEAYLESGLPHEALLFARESLKAGKKAGKKTATTPARAQLQLLEAQSALEIGNFEESARILNKTAPSIALLESGEAGRFYWLKVALSSRSCFSKKGKANQERELLERVREESHCIQETLHEFLSASTTESPAHSAWLRAAFREIREGLQIYATHCQDQPHPPQHSLTPNELRSYRKELSSELRRKCSNQLKQMQAFLANSETNPSVRNSIGDVSREIAASLTALATDSRPQEQR